MKLIWSLILLLGSAFIDVAQGANSNPCSVDAAVTFENDLVYFFKGDKYGRYSADRQIDYIGPISAWNGVPSDIDAAIKYKGNYYFFKGCHYYIWDVDAGKVVLDKRDIQKKWKAPCNLDAAITMGSYVYLFKGKKYWLWWNGDGKPVYKGGNKDIKSKFGVDGPFDAVVRWDPFDKYYFFQGEYYRRLDGKDIGKKKSISIWKGLVDSGKELLKDCPCSCNRLQSKENWKVKKVEFDIDNGQVTNLRPSNVVVKRNDLRAIDKCFKECPTVEYTAKKTVTETSRFASTTGIGLKVGTTVETGVPGLVGGKISMEASVEQKFTYGKDRTETVVRTHHFKCPGFPGTVTICHVSMKNAKMDVPYTMTLVHKKKGCVCEEKGFYKSVSVGDMMQRVSRE